jgi:hypothetical protein
VGNVWIKLISKDCVSQIYCGKQKSYQSVGLIVEEITERRKQANQKQAKTNEKSRIIVIFQVELQYFVNEHATIRNDNKKEPLFDRHSYYRNSNGIFWIETPHL